MKPLQKSASQCSDTIKSSKGLYKCFLNANLILLNAKLIIPTELRLSLSLGKQISGEFINDYYSP